MKNSKVFIWTSIICLILVFITFYITHTESGARWLKDVKSDWDGGIYRSIDIYDVNGNLIKHYEGTFDIEYSDSRIKFDDENGLRHIIYHDTGTIIVDEIDK